MDIPDGAKVAVIGVIFDTTNTEMPWRVQDYHKALETEYRCPTKADVLEKIAQILDHMSPFKG